MKELEANYRNIVVIGASAGGLEVILDVVRRLPADLPAAVFVVQHIPAYAKSSISKVLAAHTELGVKAAEDGESIRAGTIYVARADHHLLVEENRVTMTKGPRENRFRPAVDALFRSAAYAYQDRVIGVVLSGALNDGTSGMWTINHFGGTAIVQDPGEALFGDMPEGVMQYTQVQYVLKAAEIGPLINEMCRKQIIKTNQNGLVAKQRELMEIELAIAKGSNGVDLGLLERGAPSHLTCPECHGALTKFVEGRLVRYRCHTGHAHTAESLLAGIQDNVEKSMWEVMRGMEESQILLCTMADSFDEGGMDGLACRFRHRAQQIQRQAGYVQDAINEADLSAIGSQSIPSIEPEVVE